MPPPLPVGAAPGASGPAPDRSRLPAWMPSPQAAAAAVLAMLSFGVLIGSLVGPGLARTLSAPQEILVSLGGSRATSSNAGAPAAAGPGAPAASAPAQTITLPAPAPAPAPAAAAATQSPAASGSAPALSPVAPGGLPPIKHVFLIVLSDQGYSHTFGSTNAYFSRTLPQQGGLVPNYYGITAGELANGIGLISGQGPTPQTAANCQTYAALTPGGSGSLEQVLGSGCVYPARTKTLAGQLSERGHGGWKAYIEGIDGGRRQPVSCRHPALGATDSDFAPRPHDPYVTWRNPFVYFDSLTGSRTCATRDVGLSHLVKDLKHASSTAALSYIAPSPCDDGSDQPCRPGAPAGLAPAAKFLSTVLPEIERSPAYKADGLIAVTFDQAPQTGPQPDTNGCCTSQPFPNLPAVATTPTAPASTTAATSTSTTSTSTSAWTSTSATMSSTSTTDTSTSTSNDSGLPTTPTGGGQVGIVLVSRWVKPGSTDFVDSYNHFSLLATIEKLLGVPRLGYAGDAGLPLFGVANFNNFLG